MGDWIVGAAIIYGLWLGLRKNDLWKDDSKDEDY